MVWRKYEEAQNKLGRALQENAELRQKHGESLRRLDSCLADFKATMTEKDDEIAQLKSQVASRELGGNQPGKDGFREEVEAILDGLEGNVPGETLLERLSNLAHQYESGAALEQSLLDLRADFQRLKSTHSVPSPDVTHLREENSQLKEENSRLKMRLTKMTDEVQKLQKKVQEKEMGKLQTSNEVCTLIANHFKICCVVYMCCTCVMLLVNDGKDDCDTLGSDLRIPTLNLDCAIGSGTWQK